MKKIEKRKEEKKNKKQALVDSMETARLHEYAMYVNSPVKLLLMNFLIGLFRGLGSTIGLAFVLAGMFFLLQWAINSDLPLLSDWLQNFVDYVSRFKPGGNM